MMGAKVAAIVLAAGRSSRMAPRNKLLEPVGGKPIVARVAGAAIASGGASPSSWSRASRRRASPRRWGDSK